MDILRTLPGCNAKIVGLPIQFLTAADLEAAVRTIAGSARSMGVEVEGV